MDVATIDLIGDVLLLLAGGVLVALSVVALRAFAAIGRAYRDAVDVIELADDEPRR